MSVGLWLSMSEGVTSTSYNSYALFHELRNQRIEMRRYLIAALTVATIGLASTSPVLAQGYKTAVGWSGGVLYTTSLNSGATGGAELVDLRPDPIWTVGAHYDHWIGGGNIGVRAQAGFSKPTLPWVQGDREIRVYMANLDLLLRPVAPAPGKSVLPFLSGGVGFINWGFGDGPLTSFDPAAVSYDGQESFELVAVGGAGIDIVTPWHWGEGPLVIRLEGRDHIQFSSPFDPLSAEDGDFGMVHNAIVVLGFHTGIGVLGGG
jgi:hypothetical protein